MKQILQMAEILGTRRIAILVALVAINAVLAASVYLYFIPRNDQLATDLQTLSGKLSSKRSDTQTLVSQYQVIEDQKVFFGNLKNAGFFGDQNRTLIRTRIGDIQKFSNVISAKYNVAPAIVEHNPAADDAGYVVLDSPISIDVDAFDDTDFFTFVYCLENAFPGQVSVNEMKAARTQELTEPVLKQIGGGLPTSIIKGSVTFSWRTMVPATQVGGGASGAPKT